VFRRLHLEDADFWSAVDLLIGPESAYGADSVEVSPKLAVIEDRRGISRHHVFPPQFGESLRLEALLEAGRQGQSSGWLFLGGGLQETSSGLMDAFARLGSSRLKTYLLDSRHSDRLRGAPGVTPVRVAGERFEKYEIVLLLAEHASYGLLASRRPDGRLFGFHTADWTLVGGLIDKLQDAYHLQKGAT
jgi:hypothetical protein